MASLGNFWAKLAAQQTRSAHAATPTGRAVAFTVLATLWLGGGLIGWSQVGKPPLDALYSTFSAIGFSNDYAEVNQNWGLQVMRFAGPAVALFSLIAAFWRRLGQLIARMCLRLATDHVVIAGASDAALHLAQLTAAEGVVVLVAPTLDAELATSLARRGVIQLQADPTQPSALLGARAPLASHVLAFSGDEAMNLRIEAALQSIAHVRRSPRPTSLHLELRSAALLREARDLRQELERARARQAKAQPKHARKAPLVDVRPFSLAELGAREAMSRLTPRILDRCAAKGQPRPHLLLIGFDETAQALAAWVLSTLWSAHFEAPRVTVLSPDPAAAAALFRANHSEAQAHAIWRADIVFEASPRDLASTDAAVLAGVEEARGPISFAACSLPSEGDSLVAAIALLRAAPAASNHPLPVLVRERIGSEFTRQYGLDAEAGGGAAFLAPIGQLEQVAAPALILDGGLDRAAALYHTAYEAQQSQALQKELSLAARGGWLRLAETYRQANRAVADHTVVKLWDAGWRPARRQEKADIKTLRIPDELAAVLARLEHSRWSAERLLNGWRPGGERNNRARIHPDLRPWEELSVDAKAKDEGMVRMAEQVVSVLYASGLVRCAQPAQSDPARTTPS